MKCLNIGCGSNFHASWTNLDISSVYPGVQTYDIRKGLPFADLSFDVCYSSHLIEHLTQDDAKKLLAECQRVLKPKGIIRIVVPDLQEIAKNYLEALEQVQSGVVEAEPNYDWMMLELLDQSVRSYSGGKMGEYLVNPGIKNKEFVRSRIGLEFEHYWQTNKTVEPRKSILEKIQSKSFNWYADKTRITLAKLLVTLVAGQEISHAFTEGIFRQKSGQIHQWMYDHFSLRRILEEAGFIEVKACQADQSRIEDFNRYNLDMLDGKVRKPDSLFMEGIKP
ncbi:methyltransferase domain-containing protein [Oscillatoria sp. HE19RPO]|uniref:class I SAM-dependent methyltransferase n=1 Tax=Oscillatoria sp. HE19RPO TaxID=2954806 RepID=UPI0020C5979B|nr:methyltransferase domain-containing protein [Oscillatoria sp. HE19RPO]